MSLDPSDVNNWLDAGLLGLDESIDRPVETRPLYVPPAIWVDRAWLRWHRMGPDGALGTQLRSPGGRLLTDFLGLAGGNADEVLRYAQRWGVMQLCEAHQLPQGHGFNRCTSSPMLAPHDDAGWREGFAEPLAFWERSARLAKRIVDKAAELHRGPAPTAERLAVTGTVNRWLWVGGVRPAAVWSSGGPSIEYGGAGLFGALGLQLLLAINQVRTEAVCDGCGQLYEPRTTSGQYRRPRAGERHYCRECRDKKVPQRDAAREWRARQRKHQEAQHG